MNLIITYHSVFAKKGFSCKGCVCYLGLLVRNLIAVLSLRVVKFISILRLRKVVSLKLTTSEQFQYFSNFGLYPHFQKSSSSSKPSLQQMIQNLTPEQIKTFISSAPPWWEKAVNELPLQLNLPDINTSKANQKYMGSLLVNTLFSYALLARYYNFPEANEKLEGKALKKEFINMLLDIGWLLKSTTGDEYVGVDDVLKLSVRRSLQILKSNEQVYQAVTDTTQILLKNPVIALQTLKQNLTKNEKLVKRKLDFMISWSMQNLEIHQTLAMVVGTWQAGNLGEMAKKANQEKQKFEF